MLDTETLNRPDITVESVAGTGDVMFIHDCDLLNVKKHSARPALLPISPGIIYYEAPLNILFLLLLFYCFFL